MWMSDVCACTCTIICIDKDHWTQISISYLSPKKYDIKTYKHILYYIILSIHLTGLYFIKMCVYNIQYMVAALQVRCMTIVHKVADQDSVLLTIAYSNLRPMAPLVNARLSTPWFLNLMHLKQLQKHICPLRFARISHKSLNQHYHFQIHFGSGVMTTHAKTEVNTSNFDPVGLVCASLSLYSLKAWSTESFGRWGDARSR